MRVLIALILVVCAGPALAQSLASLSAQDQQAIQYSLEFEQTNAQVSLPSGARFTIVRTETRPQICRYFEVTGGQGTQQGVGCRIGNRQWELRPVGTTVSAQPTQPIYAVPRPPRDSNTGPPAADQPTTVASLPGQAGTPSVSVAPPAGGLATTVVVPRTPQPVVAPAGHTPTPAVIAPAAVAPAVTAPVPAAIGVASIDPDDFPRPSRRPGDVVPLAAAPAQMRTVPLPVQPPRADTAGVQVVASPQAETPQAETPEAETPVAESPVAESPVVAEVPLEAPPGEPAQPVAADADAAGGLQFGAEADGWTDEEVAEMRAESRQVLASPPDIPLPERPPGRVLAQVVEPERAAEPEQAAEQVAELGDETIIFFEEQGDAAVAAGPTVTTAPLPDAGVPAPEEVSGAAAEPPAGDPPAADAPAGDAPAGDAQAVASLLDQFRASDDGSVPPADQLPRQTNLLEETGGAEPQDAAPAAVA
ncbi:MAG: hypothetical protein KDA49_15870, partial [Rhodospirillaceae bacterium]|nr:hypothetical protein [Rhodospirillaceae bacterium]